MNRESGFYWILKTTESNWEVAYWSRHGAFWVLVGLEYHYSNSDIHLVNEKQLIQ